MLLRACTAKSRW